jgi:type I restriction enzyme, S subunit
MRQWRNTTLGEVCDEVNGTIQTGPFGSQLHQSDYSEVGIPVVMPKDIVEGRIQPETVARVSPAHVARLSKHKLRFGDIVYGRRGDIGRQALIREEHDGWLCGTGCLKLTLGNSIVDPLFLHYYLKQEDVVGWIANQAVGATMPNLNTAILRSVPVKFPSLALQQRIAGILSTYDELIENSQRRIKILEAMARALYREWFVRFRFPGHEGCPRVASPLGSIPMRWTVVSIEDVCARVTDGSHYSPKSVNEGKPMASSKDMHDWGLSLNTARLISSVDFTDLVRNDCKPKKNDVLITKDGANYLKYVFVTREEQEVVLLSSIAILRPNDRINPHLLAEILKAPENKDKLKNYVTGAAIPRVILKDFKRFQFLLPSKDIQLAWAKIAEPITEQIWNLIDKIENLRLTRDLLLPCLLSGQIEVESSA